MGNGADAAGYWMLDTGFRFQVSGVRFQVSEWKPGVTTKSASTSSSFSKQKNI